MREVIKKDIFVAIITNGSAHQKENWKKVAEEAYKWVIEDDTQMTFDPQMKTSSGGSTIGLPVDEPQ